MPRLCRLAILSDIHYASAAEQARGDEYETRGLTNPLARGVVRAFRNLIWLRRPLRLNHLLDPVLAGLGPVDYGIANGDYTCNSAFVGVSDDAACLSVQECLGKLRRTFGRNFLATIGDNDLGKLALLGHRGGMRLASWRRVQADLGLEPFWKVQIGEYVLLGVTSSLLALPVFEPDTLPAERGEWERLRTEHLQHIRQAFAELLPSQRVLLFCHDPTALPFLGREAGVRARLGQIEHTLIGHLHSTLILRLSRLLARMPRITFLGHSVLRFSTALGQAREWRPFNIRLCPSLAGIELLQDGGYLTADLDPDACRPVQFQFHPVAR